MPLKRGEQGSTEVSPAAEEDDDYIYNELSACLTSLQSV